MQSERKVPVPSARSLLGRRSAARRTVLLATGVTIFLLSLALSTLVALGVRGPLVATRTTLAAAAVIDSSVVVSSAPATDTAAQDAGVRSVISSVFAGVPVSVTRSHIAASGRRAETFSWTITPNDRTIRPSDLGALAKAYSTIEGRVDASGVAHSPAAQVSGHGAQTVSDMRIAIAAIGAVLPIPETVLSLAGIIALVLCARLLTATRENESRLVRARGGSVRTLVLADAVEMIAPAAIAAVIGAAAAQIYLYLSLGVPTGALEVAVAPVAILVAAIVISGIVGWLAARAAQGAPRPGSARAEIATTLSLAALLLIVSGIGTWRFLQYGTPAAGQPEDVSALVAPALLLCTAAILSLIVFFPVTGWLQRTAARRVGFVRVFPARTIHRNPRLFAGPIALLVISVATAIMASGYAATWNGFLSDSTRLVTGSDVRATFGGDATATDASSVLDRGRYLKLAGVTDVIPALREPAMIGDENITAMGFSVDHAATIVGPQSSVLDVQALTTELRPPTDPLPGIQLPAGTTALSVNLRAVSAVGGPATVIATFWLADSVGDLAPVSIPSHRVIVGAAESGQNPVRIAIPDGGPWRVVAIDGTVSPTHALSKLQFGLGSFAATTASGTRELRVSDPAAWKAKGVVFNNGTSTAGPSGEIGFRRSTVKGGTNTPVRLMPPGSATVPVVVTKALAQANQLRIGDHLDVEGQWASFDGRVSGIVPLVPGVSSQASLVADLPSIDSGFLRSSEQVPALHELWISGSPDTTIAREVTAAGDARVTAASASVSRRFVGGAVTGLWIGSAGSAAFAIVTLIASLASNVRRRTREVGVLRALGLAAAEQSRMRRSEIVVVLVYGLVIGALAGVGMLTLVVGTLARSSTPEAPAVLPLVLRFDFLTPVALVAAIVIASLLAIGRYLTVITSSAKVTKP
jgi:hypothetical protein